MNKYGCYTKESWYREIIIRWGQTACCKQPVLACIQQAVMYYEDKKVNKSLINKSIINLNIIIITKKEN